MIRPARLLAGLAASVLLIVPLSGAAAGSPARSAASPPVVRSVTLITGDVVRVSTRRRPARGRLDAGPDGAMPMRRSARSASTSTSSRNAARLLAAKRLDLDLFDVAALIELEYDDARRSTIPVIVDYGQGQVAADESRQARRSQPREKTVALPTIGAAAFAADKERARDLLALAHEWSRRNRRCHRPHGRRGAGRSRRPRRSSPRRLGAADPRSGGVGCRLRRHGHDRRRARHRLRPHASGSRRTGRGHGQLHGRRRASSTATGTAPTSPRRSSGTGAASGGTYRGVAPGARADDRQGPRGRRLRRGLVGSRRHGVGGRERRGRREHEPRRRHHRRHGPAEPRDRRPLGAVRHALRGGCRQQRQARPR